MRLLQAFSDPVFLAQLAAVSVALGYFGSKLEAVGVAVGSTKLEHVGKIVRAIFSDAPKVIGDAKAAMAAAKADKQ